MHRRNKIPTWRTWGTQLVWGNNTDFQKTLELILWLTADSANFKSSIISVKILLLHEIFVEHSIYKARFPTHITNLPHSTSDCYFNTDSAGQGSLAVFINISQRLIPGPPKQLSEMMQMFFIFMLHDCHWPEEQIWKVVNTNVRLSLI